MDQWARRLDFAVFDFGITVSSCFLDGVSVWGGELVAHRPEFAVLDFGIAFFSFPLDGVDVLGVGLSARGPID